MSTNREKQFLGALMLVSAAVRQVFYFQITGDDLAAVPLLDCQAYHDWAARLVAGDWGWHETYWMGPLYPHLLAVVYAIWGVGSHAILLLQLALTVLNIWLVHRLARNLMAAGPVAAVAAALYAGYGAPVFYAGNLLIATVATTLLLVAAIQATHAAQTAAWRPWFKLGLLLGLAGLARGNMLLLLPLCALLVPGRPRIKPVVALLVGALLMVAPVTVRNLVMADDFVVLTSNGGVNLLIGQRAAYKGIFAPITDEAQAEFDPSMETTLERERGRDLKGSEVSRILTRRAWREFRTHLGAMPRHYARKIQRFWSGYELPQIVSYDYYRGQFPALQALPVPYWFLSALGLVGFFHLPRRARLLLLIFVGGYFLSLLPFFPTSRYRQPIAPLLSIPAAAWLVAVWQQSAARKKNLVLGAVAVVLVWPAWAALDPAVVLWQVHLHEASRASKLGRLDDTLTFGKQAEAVRPGLADTPYHLSLYLEDLGEYTRAIDLLETAARRAPNNRLVPYRIGRNYEKMSLSEPALAAYLRASALDPDWGYPWFRSGLVLLHARRLDEALQAMQHAHDLAPGQRRIRSNLASLYAETGDLNRAHQLLVALTDDYPLYVNGWFNRALVAARRGRTTEALESLSVARGLRGITPQEKRQIDVLWEAIKKPRPR